MPYAGYYVVGDHDVWMIKSKDGEHGAGVIREEAVVFAIDAAQKLGARGECALMYAWSMITAACCPDGATIGIIVCAKQRQLCNLVADEIKRGSPSRSDSRKWTVSRSRLRDHTRSHLMQSASTRINAAIVDLVISPRSRFRLKHGESGMW
jgi:hypothetical protein